MLQQGRISARSCCMEGARQKRVRTVSSMYMKSCEMQKQICGRLEMEVGVRTRRDCLQMSLRRVGAGGHTHHLDCGISFTYVHHYIHIHGLENCTILFV